MWIKCHAIVLTLLHLLVVACGKWTLPMTGKDARRYRWSRFTWLETFIHRSQWILCFIPWDTYGRELGITYEMRRDPKAARFGAFRGWRMIGAQSCLRRKYELRWDNEVCVSKIWKMLGFEKIYSHPENSFFESKKHFFDIRLKKKFLWIKGSFVDSKTFCLMYTNLFLWIKENFVELTKLSLIQRRPYTKETVFSVQKNIQYFSDSLITCKSSKLVDNISNPLNHQYYLIFLLIM